MYVAKANGILFVLGNLNLLECSATDDSFKL